MSYYNNKKVLAVNNTIPVYDEELIDKTARENNLAIARTLLINLNGRELTNYSTQTTTYQGYEIEVIYYQGSMTLTEAQVKTYLSNMTGSERIPLYDYERPLNTYIMLADGTLYKMQATDRGNGNYSLVGYKVAMPFALQIDLNNLEAEVNRLKAMIYETIVDTADLDLPELTLASLPSAIDSNPIVFGAGMDCKEIKGNSLEWNQLVKNPDFSANTDWMSANSSYGNTVIADGKATWTCTANVEDYAFWAGILSGAYMSIPSGHKVLAIAKVKPSIDCKITIYGMIGGGNTYYYQTPSEVPANQWSLAAGFIFDRPANTTITRAKVSMKTDLANLVTGVTLEVDYCYFIDLTQVFGAGNEPTSVDDPRVQWVIAHANEHPEYNAGAILDSKPIKLISRDADNNILGEYPLSLPILRSAGSVQDTDKKVNVRQVDLGTLDWGFSVSSGYFYVSINDIKSQEATSQKANLLCAKYENYAWDNLYRLNTGMCLAYQQLRIKDSAYTDAATFKQAMSGVMLNYELATPIDQPSIALPENIATQEGGAIEAEYAEDYESPADFTFEVAVKRASE